MKALLVLTLALSGCATVQDFAHEYPHATAIIAASVVTSVALSTRSHSHGPVMSEPLIATPSVDCTHPGACL